MRKNNNSRTLRNRAPTRRQIAIELRLGVHFSSHLPCFCDVIQSPAVSFSRTSMSAGWPSWLALCAFNAWRRVSTWPFQQTARSNIYELSEL